jgi:RimJ/RimL family protein N-acetyltransferase
VLSGTLVELRPLQEHDVPALQAIASDPQLWEQHPAKDRTSPLVFRRWMDDALASGGALTVIGRTEDRIIGSSRFDRGRSQRGSPEWAGSWVFSSGPMTGISVTASARAMARGLRARGRKGPVTT